MPMSGGTRMLRARRKDCNVKPNRRLDRKSSRGMLFENEELRMRTITINAEVEQGQHALKKLRRENEQLRREMWCLRDEYDKMEKLLRRREEGEESDQENSDSEENCERTDESEEDKGAEQKDEAESRGEDMLQMLSPFGSEANARAFDGLSVIDEQTEETQTTESAVGYGSLSRGNSANRTFNPSTAGGELPPYAYGADPYPDRSHARRKGPPAYDHRPPSPPLWPQPPLDTFHPRPASPYPHPGPLRPSYLKRLQLLQQLPLAPPAAPDNGWLFPDPPDAPQAPSYNLYVDDPLALLPPQPPDPCPAPLPLDLLQDRAGPDLFVTGGFSPPLHPPRQPDSALAHVEARIDKIEISDKSESDPKAVELTTFAKSAVSRGAAGLSDPTEPHETLRPGKLTMDAPAHQHHNDSAHHLQHSVPCQHSTGQHVRETSESVRPPATITPPPDDMPLSERPTASKFQTKLTVTLKAPNKPPAPAAPGPTTLRPKPRSAHPPAHAPHTPPRPAPPSAPLTTPPAFPPAAPPNIPLDADNHPDLPPNDQPPPAAHPLLKPIKIPPPPPPRTSSCPRPTLPTPPLGLTASHQRTPTTGHPLHPPDDADRPPEPPACNPLLMAQPIATSTPTISLRTNLPAASAEGFWHSRGRKGSYNEDSSLEEFSRQRAKAKGELPRGEVPKLNKSLSSPSFGSFRTARRKQSEVLATSVENMAGEKGPERAEKKGGKALGGQTNASVSSSSGLDSPTKSEGRKRRVSIQLKKVKRQGRGVGAGAGGGEEGGAGKGAGERGRGRGEETDGTMSERERTNSVSSRTSSVVAGSSRRKCSISSNRTYLNEEKIPWCGCWGNGCV